MNDNNELLKSIPQVDRLLNHEEIKDFVVLIGRGIIKNIIKKNIDKFRSRLLSGEKSDVNNLIASIINDCNSKNSEKLQRVINGTGVILHTNLGRSPIGKNIFDNLSEALSGYCNLEYHIPSAKRGKRGGFAEELICEMTGAEDALIVNNNAAAVFLILTCFAKNREVIVSRGELIQIGGGFRIPDIMRESGALLVEAGTTNITDLEDFRKAVNENTAMIFSAHTSNFRMEGFTNTPSISQLATLKNHRIILVRDAGSGNFFYNNGFPDNSEPTVKYELLQGADLVCFSGDKLLGSCQAGIITGKKELISALKTHPLMRILRVDKTTYFIMQETLMKFENENYDDILLYNIFHQDIKTISARIKKFIKKTDPSIRDSIIKVNLESTFGGGSTPGETIPGAGIRIELKNLTANNIHDALLNANIPIMGIIDDGYYTLNFTTILDEDIQDIADAVNLLAKQSMTSELEK